MSAGRLAGALIGAGNVMRRGHLPGWLARPDVEIVAAADPAAGSESAIRSALPRVRWFDSAEELLRAGGIDFVDIATPPGTHARLTRAALEAGLHVLCEKPLALSSADARQLASLARKTGRVLACVHNWLFAPQVRAIADIAGSGLLGRLARIRWDVRRDRPALAAGDGPNWRTDPVMSGGGISVDHGWHALYIVLSWVGRRPDEIGARFERRIDAASPVEDTARFLLDFGDTAADISLTWAAANRSNEASLEGDAGSLALDDDRLERRSRSGEPLEVRRFESRLSAGSHHADWFGGMADEFLQEIRGLRGRGTNLDTAVACAEILEACGVSAREGGRVLRPEFS